MLFYRMLVNSHHSGPDPPSGVGGLGREHLLSLDSGPDSFTAI